MTLSDGESIEFPGCTDSPVCILFFNTACADCRRILPEVQAYADTDGRQSVVCISREEDAAAVAQYWDDNDLTLRYSAQTDRRVYNLFAQTGIPRVYVIHRGVIVRTYCD